MLFCPVCNSEMKVKGEKYDYVEFICPSCEQIVSFPRYML